MFRFLTNCVGVPKPDVPDLISMIDEAVKITRRTFLKYADRGQLARLEHDLGYFKGGLTMAKDCHVSYHRSTYKGKRCYYFRHSAIEYIFIERKKT